MVAFLSGLLSECVITDANVIPRTVEAGCPGGVSTLADVVRLMRAEGAYTNVHTVAHPGGETRGNIQELVAVLKEAGSGHGAGFFYSRGPACRNLAGPP